MACARGASGTPNAAPSGSYLDCLREHGVNLPQGVASGRSRPSGFGPSGLGPSGIRPSGIRPSGVVRSGGSGAGGFFGTQAPAGVDQSTWEKALQACAALRPSVNPSRLWDNGAAGRPRLARRAALYRSRPTLPGRRPSIRAKLVAFDLDLGRHNGGGPPTGPIANPSIRWSFVKTTLTPREGATPSGNPSLARLSLFTRVTVTPRTSRSVGFSVRISDHTIRLWSSNRSLSQLATCARPWRLTTCCVE